VLVAALVAVERNWPGSVVAGRTCARRVHAWGLAAAVHEAQRCRVERKVIAQTVMLCCAWSAQLADDTSGVGCQAVCFCSSATIGSSCELQCCAVTACAWQIEGRSDECM
jgi:hypothetical protein